MNIEFDPRRSEAIRAGLVAEASNATAQRHPWRGLALVLAGVLAGSGATTAAFASGQGLPLGPTASPSSGPIEPEDVSGLEMPFDGKRAGVAVVTTDPTSGEIRVEYQWTDKLRELAKVQIVVKEPDALDLSGHPAEASYAWVSFSCRGKGGIAMNRLKDGLPIAVSEAGSEDDESSSEIIAGGDDDSSGGLTLATLLHLNDVTEQIKPTQGCVADATVTYYAKE
jgi:hypothetical protein